MRRTDRVDDLQPVFEAIDGRRHMLAEDHFRTGNRTHISPAKNLAESRDQRHRGARGEHGPTDAEHGLLPGTTRNRSLA
jgi:hypothetical protein